MVSFVLLDNIIDYINRNFGIIATVEPLDKKQFNKLPLYLKNGFKLSGGHIGNRAVLFAKPEDLEESTPKRLLTLREELIRYFDRPVVFVFDQLDSWLRKRLIEKHLGFIQSGRQIFVPELLLELNDLRNRNYIRQDISEHLGFPTQAAILCHLQRTPLDALSFQHMASLLDYSAMTVTRVAREIEQFGLAKIARGKDKSIIFEHGGRELWRQVLPFLRSPVKAHWYADSLSGFTSIVETGETALARYSALAEGAVNQFALGKEQFRSFRKLIQLPELNAFEGNMRIDVWHYDPRIVAGHAALAVDKLSLYLSMRENTDERTKDALEEMLNGMTW